jgi:hypothetical protein
MKADVPEKQADVNPNRIIAGKAGLMVNVWLIHSIPDSDREMNANAKHQSTTAAA